MSGRARVLAGLAVVVAGGLAAGAAYALDQSTGSSTPTALASPTLAPAPSATPPASPTPAAPPSPTTTPTAAPTPTRTPTATRSASARPSAVRYYAYPAPTKTYEGLAFSAEVNPQSGSVGQTFTFVGYAKDGDGTIFVTSIDWGDGTVDGGEASPNHCPAYPSPTTNPGPYQPAPDKRTFTRTHVYTAAGTYKLVAKIRSINADCHPHGPKTETASVTFTGPYAIHVT
jgi:hypothetical protein